MKFTLTVRLQIEAQNGANAIGITNDLFIGSGIAKHEIITVRAGGMK